MTIMHPGNRLLHRYATFVVGRPLTVLLILLVLGAVGGWGASKLSINSNQLDLISKDLPEVKDVKRLIDMVGGSGYLMLALRSEQEPLMKQVADDLAALLQADAANIRSVTYRMPRGVYAGKGGAVCRPQRPVGGQTAPG